MYRAMLCMFLDLTSSDLPTTDTESRTAPTNLLEETAKLLSEVKGKTTDDFRQTFNAEVAATRLRLCHVYDQFKQFAQSMACKNDTWRFWIQFVFVDAMAYVNLYLAIRSGNWCLRMSSIKTMAAIFTAFDHQTYQKLISNHISDLLSLPPSISVMFQQGAFVPG